jgi:subtilisin family serine protease
MDTFNKFFQRVLFFLIMTSLIDASGVRAASLLPASPESGPSDALFPAASPEGLQPDRFAADRFLVKLKKEIPKGLYAQNESMGLAHIDRLNRQHGVLQVRRLIREGGGLTQKERHHLSRIFSFQVAPGSDIGRLIETYRQSPDVEYVEPDYLVTAAALPNDPMFSEQWSLGNSGQTGGTPNADIHAVEAWDIATGNSGVVIAILDTGVDLSHPELMNKLVPGYDFVHDSPNPWDDHGHGTAVAGVAAAATNNGLGLSGVCWDCSIMPVKVLDSTAQGLLSQLVNGIVWAADHGARVMNLSLFLSEQGGSPALSDALNYADSMGVVLVSPRGNFGNSNFVYPAHHPLVLSVGGTNPQDQRAPFSSFGPDLDVVAPGEGILSTYPGQTYVSLSGTSVASPHVAGLAGLLISLNPALTPADVRTIIKHTADDQVGDPAEDVPGYDRFYGWGRINAVNALLMANAPPPDPPRIALSANELTLNTVSDPSKILFIENSGSGTLTWDAHTDVPGLALSPSNGGVPASLSVSADASVLSPGVYTGTITVTSPDASNSPQTLSASVTVPQTFDPRMKNLSIRSLAGTGPNVQIGGFIIGGSTPKTVLLRARGPSLSGAPFNLSGTLSNPTIKLFSGGTVIAHNDDWQTTDPLCLSPALSCGNAGQISASGIDPCQPNPGQTIPPPACTRESSIFVTLPPGNYSAVVSGAGGTTGLALMEVFEVNSADANKVVNFSTRAKVQTGNKVLIEGFIVQGSTPKTVMLRARGPSLGVAPFNLPGVLANPTVKLYSGSTVIAQNDNWQTADPLCVSPAMSCGGVAEITATSKDPCQPNPGQTRPPMNCSKESALYVTLPPGNYSAVVSGVGGTSGLGLVEVFEVP